NSSTHRETRVRGVCVNARVSRRLDELPISLGEIGQCQRSVHYPTRLTTTDRIGPGKSQHSKSSSIPPSVKYLLSQKQRVRSSTASAKSRISFPKSPGVSVETCPKNFHFTCMMNRQKKDDRTKASMSNGPTAVKNEGTPKDALTSSVALRITARIAVTRLLKVSIPAAFASRMVRML